MSVRLHNTERGACACGKVVTILFLERALAGVTVGCGATSHRSRRQDTAATRPRPTHAGVCLLCTAFNLTIFVVQLVLLFQGH